MGAHIAVALAFISLALTCVLNAGGRDQAFASWLIVFAVLFVCAAVIVLLHARDHLPAPLRALLDSLIGPPPHRAGPEPDMKLIDALAQACSCEIAVGADNMPAFPPVRGQDIADALKEIRQQARLERLNVWGRPDARVGDEDFVLLSPVPADQWPLLSLAYTDFVTYAPGMAVPIRDGAAPPYLDIRLNRRQVQTFPFAHRHRRWKLRSPIYRG